MFSDRAYPLEPKMNKNPYFFGLLHYFPRLVFEDS